MSSEAWTDFPSGVKMRSCSVCGQHTKSHAICLEDDGTDYRPANPEEHDLMIPVCHSCYEDHDGDAEKVAAALSIGRDPMLDELGLTPGMISDAIQADSADAERKKAFGEKPTKEMVRDLGPGDIIVINDGRSWVVIPTTEETKQSVNAQMHHALVTVDDSAGAGGIIDGDGPKPHFARQVGEMTGMTVDPIHTMELVGHKEVDLEADFE